MLRLELILDLELVLGRDLLMDLELVLGRKLLRLELIPDL